MLTGDNFWERLAPAKMHLEPGIWVIGSLDPDSLEATNVISRASTKVISSGQVAKKISPVTVWQGNLFTGLRVIVFCDKCARKITLGHDWYPQIDTRSLEYGCLEAWMMTVWIPQKLSPVAKLQKKLYPVTVWQGE